MYSFLAVINAPRPVHNRELSLPDLAFNVEICQFSVDGVRGGRHFHQLGGGGGRGGLGRQLGHGGLW